MSYIDIYVLVHFTMKRFNSLHDLASKSDQYACNHLNTLDALERAGYSRMIFKSSAQTDIERILALENGDMGCDGVIISRSSLEILSKNSEHKDIVCSLYPLFEEDIFVSSVVIPIGPSLGEVGKELLMETNDMLSKFYFTALYNEEIFMYDRQSACKFMELQVEFEVQFRSFILPIFLAVLLSCLGVIVKLREIKQDKTFQKNQLMDLKNYETLSSSELFDNLSRRSGVNRAVLHEAVLLLPDMSGLHDICRDILEGSPSHRHFLECFDVFELYWAAKQYCNESIRSLIDDAFNKEGQNMQKAELIDLIMTHKVLKMAVLEHLNHDDDCRRGGELKSYISESDDSRSTSHIENISVSSSIH